MGMDKLQNTAACLCILTGHDEVLQQHSWLSPYSKAVCPGELRTCAAKRKLVLLLMVTSLVCTKLFKQGADTSSWLSTARQ